MAGLFPSICGCQNVDEDGQPLAFSVLTVYNGGTLALASCFQDIGLAIPAQNPMTADITGRLPFFYVNDGIYRVRLVDQNGVLIYDYPQVASIGASSSGGGGSAVDPTTIFQTGDELFRKIGGQRVGWVRQNGLTIGSATSGGSERANADTQNLFLYLWANYTNVSCPVVGGRGASAAADWAANKQITLPDMRGRAAFGKDGMGNARANLIPDSNVSSSVSGGPDTGDTDAAFGGQANQTASTALSSVNQLPLFTPTGAIGGSQTIGLNTGGIVNFDLNGVNISVSQAPGQAYRGQYQINGTNFNFTGTPIGSAAPAPATSASFAVMNPFVLGTWFIKL